MIRAILLTAALSTAALIAPTAPALAAAQEALGDQAKGVGAQLTKEDRQFFDDAAQGGLLEVKLGQLVAKQGGSDEVKRFAQRMVDDHGKVNQRLADLAQKEGLIAPQELDKKHQEQVDKLAQYSGTKLDQEYMGAMVSDHEDDVKAFEKEAKDGKDPGLRQFAASTLPLLNEHLALARQINDHIKK
jgi:putative membrane protein